MAERSQEIAADPLEQSAVCLRPLNRIASQLFDVAWAAKHLEVFNAMPPATGERHDMVKLQLCPLPAVGAPTLVPPPNLGQRHACYGSTISPYPRPAVGSCGVSVGFRFGQPAQALCRSLGILFAPPPII